MPHRIGQMRDQPAEPYRSMLVLFPLDVAQDLDERLEQGGLADPSERDAYISGAVRQRLDAERRGPAASTREEA